MQSQQNSQFGQQDQSTNLDQSIALNFIVSQILNDIQTASLVEIVGVEASGIGPVGFVDVKPLVNQMTGDRKAVEHGVIYKIPYFRIQGGKNAIILDPEIGDIGVCVFCSRDSSAVVATKKAANPGSFRKFDWSDGMYIGGFLNDTPTQYIQFSTNGIKITSPTKIILDAPEVEATGKITAQGVIKSLSDVLAKTISLFSHITTGVRSGSDTSGPPQ